jgi:RNA polymerase sigma factor (sigma-70 family)
MAYPPEYLPISDPETLLESHMALAYGIAKRYTNRGLPLEDLRQEALLGLLDAAKSYAASKGAGFATYATYWIKKRIIAALDREGKCGGALSGTADPDSLRDESVPVEQCTSPTHPRMDYGNVSASSQTGGLTLPDDLPEAERAVLDACYNLRHPLKQVAADMGISVERVKHLRCKALRRIRHRWDSLSSS